MKCASPALCTCDSNAAMLTPLRSNMSTSFGMSLMVAICAVGIASSADSPVIKSRETGGARDGAPSRQTPLHDRRTRGVQLLQRGRANSGVGEARTRDLRRERSASLGSGGGLHTRIRHARALVSPRRRAAGSGTCTNQLVSPGFGAFNCLKVFLASSRNCICARFALSASVVAATAAIVA